MIYSFAMKHDHIKSGHVFVMIRTGHDSYMTCGHTCRTRIRRVWPCSTRNVHVPLTVNAKRPCLTCDQCECMTIQSIYFILFYISYDLIQDLLG